MLEVGQKYIVRPTAQNAKNNLIPGKEARIAHVDSRVVSVRIFQNGSELKLVGPKDMFGANFEERRSFVPPNRAYASPVPFINPYI
jgi:hypothetical protein